MTARNAVITILPPLTKVRSFNCISPPLSVSVTDPSHTGLLSLSNTLNQLGVPEASITTPVLDSPIAVATPSAALANAGFESGMVTSLTADPITPSDESGRGAV